MCYISLTFWIYNFLMLFYNAKCHGFKIQCIYLQFGYQYRAFHNWLVAWLFHQGLCQYQSILTFSLALITIQNERVSFIFINVASDRLSIEKQWTLSSVCALEEKNDAKSVKVVLIALPQWTVIAIISSEGCYTCKNGMKVAPFDLYQLPQALESHANALERAMCHRLH